MKINKKKEGREARKKNKTPWKKQMKKFKTDPNKIRKNWNLRQKQKCNKITIHTQIHSKALSCMYILYIY